MAVYVIGDIHGDLSALRDLLSQIQTEAQARDKIIILGDIIDRGPDTRGCVEELLALEESHAAGRGPEMIALLGNHEQWMLKSLDNPTSHSWLMGMDGLATIRSYSSEVANVLEQEINGYGSSLVIEKPVLSYHLFERVMPARHQAFFRGMRTHFKAPGLICVHAAVPVKGDPLQGAVQDYVWGVSGFPERYAGQVHVAYGHHNNHVLDESGRPAPKILANRTYGLDTIAAGVLTAMRFPEQKVFQSGRERRAGVSG